MKINSAVWRGGKEKAHVQAPRQKHKRENRRGLNFKHFKKRINKIITILDIFCLYTSLSLPFKILVDTYNLKGKQ